MFSTYIYKWLDVALDYGISEPDYWNMTLGELERLIQSKKRLKLQESRERATFDYTLADLVGRSLSRIYSSSAKMPEISEVYPTLFDGKEIEEKKREQKAKISAIRFTQFMTSHNSKINKGGCKTE